MDPESESKFNPDQLNQPIKEELIDFDEIKIKTEIIENIKIENLSDKEDSPDFIKQEDYEEIEIKKTRRKKKYNCDMYKKSVRKKHKCNICLKTFTHNHNLKKHLECHTEKKISSKKKKYHCTVCQKILTGITSIQRHMLIHTGEKNYTCVPCNRSFALKSSLKKHERTHRDKKYQCDYCNKVLTSQKFLNNHLRLHLEEKKYTCTVCNCNFGIESSLRRHEVKHRADFRKHICSVCNRVFNSSDTLNVHFQLHNYTKKSEVEEENTQIIKTEYEDNINENIQ